MAHDDDETFTARLPNGERVTCRVKRDINTNARGDTFKKIFEKATRDEGDGGASASASGDGAGGDSVDDHPLMRLAAVLVASGNFRDRAHAIRYLLQHPSGHQLVRTHKGVEPMDRTAELRDIVKTHGPVALAKLLVEDGDSHGISEAELTDAITSHAKAEHPNLTKEQAFDKVFSASDEQGLLLRKAVAVAKAAPFVSTPIVVGGEDFNPDNPEAAVAAYNELLALAAEYRKAKPALTEAQAFDAVFTSKENADLAARAHRRPTPPPGGIYAYPRT
jgi:hypothetical protein